MANKIVYNKLVRDRIPKIIESTGKTYELHVADKNEYVAKLHEKLSEESKEFLETPNVEEMADILEVIDTLIDFYDLDRELIKQYKENKNSNRGSFKEKYILDYVVETDE